MLINVNNIYILRCVEQYVMVTQKQRAEIEMNLKKENTCLAFRIILNLFCFPLIASCPIAIQIFILILFVFCSQYLFRNATPTL